jgi:hypothetical protein
MNSLRRSSLAFASWVVGFGIFAAGSANGGTNSWSFVGPDGGPAWSIAVHPTNSQILLASTWRGLARSTNRGQSWDVITDGFLGTPVPIAFDPITPSRVFTAGPFFMLSEDTGATFQSAQGPNAPNGISHLVFTSDGTLYAMLYQHGAAKATAPYVAWTNLQTTWPANTTPSTVGTVASNPNLLFVGVYEQGIYRTTNGGTSWSGRLNLGISNLAQFSVNRIEVDPNNEQIVFAATSEGLYRSTNQGDTWTQINGPTTSVAINPANSMLVTALYYGGGVIRSTDGGLNWPSSGNGFQLGVYGIPQGYFVPNDPGRMWFISNYGIAESPDAGTIFLMRNSGLRGGSVQHLVAADDHTVYASLNSASGSIFRRATPDYQPLNVAAYVSSIQTFRNLSALSVAAGDSNRIIAVNSNIELIQTLNGGASWTTPHPAFTAGANADFISDVQLAPSNPNIAYAGRSVTGVWKTSNGGSTYAPLVNSPPYIQTIGVDPSDANVVFVSGGAYNTNGIYKTTDGGLTWQQKRAPDGPLWTHSFSFSPVDSNVIYASRAGGVLKTTDGGNNWSLVDFGGSTGTTAFGTNVLFDPLIPTTLMMVSTSGSPGFARSVDGGATWAETSLSISGPTTGLEAAVMLGPGELIVGTTTAGVAEYTVAPNLELTATALALPLPVSSNASITYTVTNRGPHASSASQLDINFPSWLTPSVPANCTRTGALLRCQLGALRVDQSVSVPLTLAVAATPASTQAQIGSNLTGHESDAAMANNSISANVYSAEIADVDVAFSGGATTFDRTQTTSVTATVSNAGPSPSTATILTLQIPSNLEISNITAQGTCQSNAAIITCNLGTLPSNATTDVTFTVTGSAAGTSIIAAGVQRAGIDPDNSHGASRDFVVRAVADLGVAVADSADPVTAGGAFQYTATINNAGPDGGALSSTVTVTGATVTSATVNGGTCTNTATAATCTLTALASGASAAITVNVNAVTAGAATASATVTFSGTDSVGANNSATANTTISAPPPPPPRRGGGGRFDWLFAAILGLLASRRARLAFARAAGARA